MKEIIIIGGGGHAKVLISVLKKDKAFKVLGYTDVKSAGDILGVPYLGTDAELEELFAGGIKYAAMGIGKITVEDKRQIIKEKVDKIGFKFPPIISKDAIVNEEVRIDDGVQIFDGVVINSGTQIRECAIINTNATIEHDCVIGEYTHIAPGATLSGGVIVGTNCMIGSNASIIQNVTISHDIMVGAGGVVIKSISAKGKFAGCPVKFIS